MSALHRLLLLSFGLVPIGCSALLGVDADAQLAPPPAAPENDGAAAAACGCHGQCGFAPDGCGGYLQCPDCTDGLRCGAQTPNQCGRGACKPATCDTLGCGPQTDGCGHPLECSPCSPAQDAAVEDAATDAADASLPSDGCPPGQVKVGEYATWFGKVNIYRPVGGAWTNDPGCDAGADVNTLAYCQELWPQSVSQQQLPEVTPEAKPFSPAGCTATEMHPGEAQYLCCAPG